jgi:AcrR family transcriptional regulator
MPKTRRSQGERRAESYRKLLASAQEVLSEKGYHAATIDEIVKRAGYSQGAFYTHWASKDDMVMDLVRGVASAQKELLRNLSGDSKQVFASLKQGDPKLFFELWLMAARGHSLAPFLREHYREWRRQVAEFVRRLHSSSSIEAQQTGHNHEAFQSALLISLFDGIIIQSQLEPELFNSLEFNESLDRFLKQMLEV